MINNLSKKYGLSTYGISTKQNHKCSHNLNSNLKKNTVKKG